MPRERRGSAVTPGKGRSQPARPSSLGKDPTKLLSLSLNASIAKDKNAKEAVRAVHVTWDMGALGVNYKKLPYLRRISQVSTYFGNFFKNLLVLGRGVIN
jgi:hypothetical protein